MFKSPPDLTLLQNNPFASSHDQWGATVADRALGMAEDERVTKLRAWADAQVVQDPASAPYQQDVYSNYCSNGNILAQHMPQYDAPVFKEAGFIILQKQRPQPGLVAMNPCLQTLHPSRSLQMPIVLIFSLRCAFLHFS